MRLATLLGSHRVSLLAVSAKDFLKPVEPGRCRVHSVAAAIAGRLCVSP